MNFTGSKSANGTTSSLPMICLTCILGGLPVLAFAASQLAPIYLGVLTLIALLAVVCADGYSRLRHMRWNNAWVWGIAGFLLWGAGSSLWSIDPDQSLVRVFRLALLALFGGTAIAAARSLPVVPRATLAVLVGAVLLIYALSVNEAVTGIFSDTLWKDAPLIERSNLLNRPATYLCLLVWPACYALARLGYGRIALLLAGGLPFALLWTSAAAAFVSALSGAAILGISLASRRVASILVAMSSVVMAVLLPLLFVQPAFLGWAMGLAERFGELSGAHRIGIWHFTAARIADRPLFGWGLDTSRVIPGGDAPLGTIPTLTDVIAGAASRFPTLATSEALSLHPHNAMLQIELELGAIGGVLFCGLIAFWAIRLASPEGGLRASFVLACTTSWLCIVFISIGIWQSWWLALTAVTVVLFILVDRSVEDEAQAPR